MATSAAVYEVEVRISVKQSYYTAEVLKHTETISVEVEDFPGLARVTNQFHRAFVAMRKIGKVK